MCVRVVNDAHDDGISPENWLWCSNNSCIEARPVPKRCGKLPEADNIYLSVKTFNGIVMLAEVSFRPGTGNAAITVKSAQPQYVQLLAASIEKLLKS